MGQTYVLAFSACKTWLISADEPLQQWLDYFADLLGLPAALGISDGADVEAIHCRPGNRDDFHPYTFLTEGCRDDEEERLYRFQTTQVSRTSQGIIADVDNSRGFTFQIVNMMFLLFPVYRDVLERGGIPVHAALVEKDGKAYLIAGSSGKGKSTCCKRIGDGWRCHCDDESLVVPDPADGYRVHPVPTWSTFIFNGPAEKTWQSMRSFPLRGIFYLDQAETDEVSLFPNNAFKAAFLNDAVLQFWHRYSNYFHEALRKKLHGMIFRNACSIADVVPAYRLAATIDGHFWKAMENALGSDDRTGTAI